MSETDGQEPENYVDKIRRLVIEEMTRQGLKRSALAQSADVALPTASAWLDGKYAGSNENIARKFEQWLQVVEDTRKIGFIQAEAMQEFVETPTAAKIIQALAYAQATPEMVLITGSSGIGKTTTIEHFQKSRGKTVYLVTIHPLCAGLWPMLYELAEVTGVQKMSGKALVRTIGEQLRRNGRHTLLIVDEAQLLSDQAVNQLRHFLDIYKCGIALAGNDEVYTRWGHSAPKEGYGQLHRRIGMRIRELKPQAGDIEAILKVWKVEDPKQREFLTQIGKKPGTLGQIDKTMRLASILAAGQSRAIDIADIRAAWINRGGEVY